MLFQHGRICGAQREDYPKKYERIFIGLEISGFGIDEYYVRSESGRMIAFCAQAYYIPELPKYLRIF